MTIQGLHHITLVSSDAQQTVDFYTGVLGLRFLKKTVNFDDPGSYHLYFGDETGSPGSAITFFEWAQTPKGFPGIGGTHHFALIVRDYDGLLKWKRRLTDLGHGVKGPYDRFYFQSIYFKDPDGANIEIATAGPGMTVDESPETLGTEYREPPEAMMIANRDEETIKTITWEEPVPLITPDMALSQGMHHITAMAGDVKRT
ncbi:MAG TPA: VOC family protein, partial [Aggregatilineales bacterium]|nr:VOC family protein [Aggregatilineales bacterium]